MFFFRFLIFTSFIIKWLVLHFLWLPCFGFCEVSGSVGFRFYEIGKNNVHYLLTYFSFTFCHSNYIYSLRVTEPFFFFSLSLYNAIIFFPAVPNTLVSPLNYYFKNLMYYIFTSKIFTFISSTAAFSYYSFKSFCYV